MKKRLVIPISLFFIGLTPLLFSIVKQVRVTAEKATVYAEPSRNSSRIDVVEKGAVLNLFQQDKIRDVWYYVSYISANYGGRISGFIHESSVEVMVPEGALQPKQKKVIKPEKPQPAAAPEKPAPPSPKIAEKKEIKPEPVPVVTTEVSLGLTALPKMKSFKFPRKVPQRQEIAWKPPAIPEKKEEKKAIEVGEFMVPTAMPRPRSIALPKKEKVRQDEAWPIIVPAKEEKKKPPEQVIVEAPKKIKPAKPAPAPEVKKVQPEIKKEKPEKKAELKKEVTKIKPEPEKPKKEKPPQIIKPAPVQPSQRVEPQRARGPLTFSLGYGPSFGGAGGFLQLNTKLGLSLHGGVGMYPTKFIYSGTSWVKNELLWSAGVKYYLPFKSRSLYPYIDLQYGGLSVEAAQIITGIWESSYVYSYLQKTLWGPSFLVGTEIRIGRFGINGAAGVSYNLTKWEFIKQNLLFAFDASLVIYF
jgi:hypothetical protein